MGTHRGPVVALLVAAVVPASAFADGAITGKVTDQGTGAPIGKYLVEAWTPKDKSASFTACTVADGTYKLSVGAGSYQVHFSGQNLSCQSDPSTLAPEWWTSFNTEGVGVRANADVIEVKDGATTPNINVALVDGARISGTVTSASNGMPLPHVGVALLDPAGAVVASYCTVGDGRYVLDPIAGGVYSLRFAAAGPYQLCAQAGPFLPQWYKGASSQVQATAISIGDGEEQNNLNAALKKDALQTTLKSAKISSAAGKASFRFTGSKGLGPYRFECALTRKGAKAKYGTCRSAKSYRKLKKGTYVFSVRARDGLGVTDATPARKTFTIR